LQDPALYHFVPQDPPATLEALERRYAQQIAGPADPAERWWNWTILERNGASTALGNVELSVFENGERAQLAYQLVRAAWNRGYATEACSAALRFLRENAPGVVVEAFVDTRNARSIALLERLAFRAQETILGADHFKGSPSDEYRYRLV
jgi:RimJ/RimL family protein N-acetyltransferase